MARMIPGLHANHFYALFDEDDVDFEIEINNASKDRSLSFHTHRPYIGFVTHSNKSCTIQTLYSDGRRLHFNHTSVTHSVGRNLRFKDTIVKHSEVKFYVEYAEPPIYPIYVKNGTRGKVSLEVHRKSTVGDLKRKIQSKLMIRCSYQLINFKGQNLDDNNETMEILYITEHSILDL